MSRMNSVHKVEMCSLSHHPCASFVISALVSLDFSLFPLFFTNAWPFFVIPVSLSPHMHLFRHPSPPLLHAQVIIDQQHQQSSPLTSPEIIAGVLDERATGAEGGQRNPVYPGVSHELRKCPRRLSQFLRLSRYLCCSRRRRGCLICRWD